MRREERVTVQGPVKEQQPDGMSHRGSFALKVHGAEDELSSGHDGVVVERSEGPVWVLGHGRGGGGHLVTVSPGGWEGGVARSGGRRGVLSCMWCGDGGGGAGQVCSRLSWGFAWIVEVGGQI